MTENISSILNISNKSADTFLQAVKEKGYIEIKGKNIFLKSTQFSKGKIWKWKNKDITFTRIYHNPYRFLYNHLSGRLCVKLGYLIRLIPYLHQKYNIVCRYPTEENIENIGSLDAKDICNITGYTTNQSSRFIKDLECLQLDNHQPAFIYDRINKRAIVNPTLFYAGDDQKLVLEKFKFST